MVVTVRTIFTIGFRTFVGSRLVRADIVHYFGRVRTQHTRGFNGRHIYQVVVSFGQDTSLLSLTIIRGRSTVYRHRNFSLVVHCMGRNRTGFLLRRTGFKARLTTGLHVGI